MSDRTSAVDDEAVETDPIESNNFEVREAASSSVPEEMEAAIRNPKRKQMAFGFSSFFGSGIGDSVTEVTSGVTEVTSGVTEVTSGVSDVTSGISGIFSTVFAAQDAAGDPTETVVSKRSSVEDLVEAYEQSDE